MVFLYTLLRVLAILHSVILRECRVHPPSLSFCASEATPSPLAREGRSPTKNLSRSDFWFGVSNSLDRSTRGFSRSIARFQRVSYRSAVSRKREPSAGQRAKPSRKMTRLNGRCNYLHSPQSRFARQLSHTAQGITPCSGTVRAGRMRSLVSLGTHSATRLCYEMPRSSSQAKGANGWGGVAITKFATG